MEVKLYTHTPYKEVLNKLYVACRTCYNVGDPITMSFDIDEVSDEDKIKLIRHVLNSGHHSVIEHISLTFLIKGVSRSLTHQLVRHRMCSFSQQSQRYCTFKDGKFDNVEPVKIMNNDDAHKIYEDTISVISEAYNKLINLGIPAEDARALLPNSCCTNIVVTTNLRELIHICNERLCTCAQTEIRLLVKKMADEVLSQYIFMKDYLVPKCLRDGYCTESKTRSCGRMPLKKDVLSVYNNK